MTPGAGLTSSTPAGSAAAAIAGRRIRLTAVMSHPVQYMAPLFRHLAEHPELELTVIYVTLPTPQQQGSGFGIPFSWDVPLLDGYAWRACRVPRAHDDYERFLGIDDRRLPDLVLDTDPDIVLVSGWHFAALLRATLACQRAGIPVLYRGDNQLPPARDGWRGWLRERRTQALLAAFDGYLAVGSRSRAFLDHFGAPPERVFDSPHCVDNAHFAAGTAPFGEPEARRALRASLGLAAEDLVVLFVGKLDPIKRPFDLLRAAAKCSSRATLLVVGSGPLLEACRREAQRSGIRAVFTGFVNQTGLPGLYAAADLLALPSECETWGLVVNEALACGLPCVVSAGVGCAPDLVVPGVTGQVFPVGDVGGLSAAIDRIGETIAAGHDFRPACRARAATHSLAAAATGVVAAAHRLARPARRPPRANDQPPRVLAALTDFVVIGGLERMTFEVLRTIRSRGADVHCITNDWEHRATAAAAESAGATWSKGTPYFDLSRRSVAGLRPALSALVGIARTSAHLGGELRSTRATHVLLPTHMAGLRAAPTLLVARALGVRTVLRLGTATGRGRLQAAIWRHAVDPLIDDYVCNSRFTLESLLATGATARKARIIYNSLPGRGAGTSAAIANDGVARVVYVGQVIPEKGVLELLEAFALVSRRAPDLELDVVGRITGWEAPCHAGYLEAVRRRAAADDLAGRVHFLGWREDVGAVLQGATMHCCPSSRSIREGFGIVCLEAKTAGVPSVVTPSGALPEVVRHGVDGWVCRGDGTDAIAEGIQALLDLPAERRREMGRAARDDAVRRFSTASFETAWLRVFSARHQPRTLRRVPAWTLPVLALHPFARLRVSWT